MYIRGGFIGKPLTMGNPLVVIMVFGSCDWWFEERVSCVCVRERKHRDGVLAGGATRS
ncbi:hypothetical protein Hanom_Chr00s000907g01670011 [Helianthus anomalus]